MHMLCSEDGTDDDHYEITPPRLYRSTLSQLGPTQHDLTSSFFMIDVLTNWEVAIYEYCIMSNYIWNL